jgi:hypothetical protein
MPEGRIEGSLISNRLNCWTDDLLETEAESCKGSYAGNQGVQARPDVEVEAGKKKKMTEGEGDVGNDDEVERKQSFSGSCSRADSGDSRELERERRDISSHLSRVGEGCGGPTPAHLAD